MDRSAPGCPADGAVFGAAVEAEAVEAVAAVSIFLSFFLLAMLFVSP